MAERMQAFEAGLTPDPRPFNIADLEGTDLSAIFEDMISSFQSGQDQKAKS